MIGQEIQSVESYSKGVDQVFTDLESNPAFRDRIEKLGREDAPRDDVTA